MAKGIEKEVEDLKMRIDKIEEKLGWLVRGLKELQRLGVIPKDDGKYDDRKGLYERN